MKPLLCLDFDGVIHSYTSGWKGAAIIPDPPVPGAIEFIIAALEHFDVAIFSSRSGERGGIDAMKSWLGRQIMDRINEKTIYDHRTAHAIVDRIEWPKSKPPAFLTIDDRALTFSGWWPKPQQLLDFKTWQEESWQRPLVAMAEPATEVIGRVVDRIIGNTMRELARAEPYTEEEFRLAEKISVAVAEQRRDDDGKVTAYRLPADVAIIAARAVLSLTREKPAARVPFAWARMPKGDGSEPPDLPILTPWDASRMPEGDGWFPLYRED